MNRFGGFRGLGTTEQAQSAASLAATGAKVGSIIPGIGTVIGAVVGAVVGWLGAKRPPPRPSAQQIAECKSLLSEYMGYAGQMPDKPIPLEKEQLRQLNWCMDAIYGGKVGLKDPRFFDPDFEGTFVPMARAVVKAIYETPVGGTVNLAAIAFKFKGQTFATKGYSFVNPQFTNLKTFCDQYFIPMAVQMCKETAGKGAGGCQSYYGETPEFRRWLYDLLGWAARTELPNISEADLAAASAVAVTLPGTSAKDVVSAVEQIIGRTVKSGETSAVLTPSTGPPPVLPTVPTTSPTETPPSAQPVSPVLTLPRPRPQPQPRPPTQTEMPTLPEVPSVQPLPFTPLQPMTGDESSSFAPIAKPSAPTTAAPVAETGGVSPWLIGGGLLAAFLLLGKKRKRA